MTLPGEFVAAPAPHWPALPQIDYTATKSASTFLWVTFLQVNCSRCRQRLQAQEPEMCSQGDLKTGNTRWIRGWMDDCMDDDRMDGQMDFGWMDYNGWRMDGWV